MDTLRGRFDDLTDTEADYDSAEDDFVSEPPPAAIGQDERRMQVRAYNHWASLLEDRNFPAIDALEPSELPDFGPYSVLLDFSAGVEDPGISYLGDKLAAECGVNPMELRSLSDVPGRSLLSRITDHYMQIIANQAPIGFEAEFVNQRGHTILYRGILLPYSSDDDTIDFIYGVINWKELADQQDSDELLLEIDQALDARPESAPGRPKDNALTDWADGPGSEPVPDLPSAKPAPAEEDRLPRPSFGLDLGSAASEAARPADRQPLELNEEYSLPSAATIEPETLADWLVLARDMAAIAHTNDERTRHALYEAIGRAYDFSLAAAQAPDEFVELLEDAGIATQKRAPMTPVVKLVFGADYDKTRITEYATALSHAHRIDLPRGALADFIGDAEGGLKGVVSTERRLRREEAGKPASPAKKPNKALTKKLRSIEPAQFSSIPNEGSEFGLVVIRRTGTGEVVMLGEVPEDVALVEKAARRLLD
ncbi:hypothetical protein WYH_02234 [Croceibacterium atlanticum]|uniref:Uncharacterized protein n=2 Tax=Croceibacterium atlanticum TaxID=1267766 RepID=A0A0F7KVR6_9SPHN|nr:hypothetical protein [Croceibacterium atlanticum]AKH43266.1 hypothetical protein WYH_02234 [Croceibacterium atlanticum]